MRVRPRRGRSPATRARGPSRGPLKRRLQLAPSATPALVALLSRSRRARSTTCSRAPPVTGDECAAPGSPRRTSPPRTSRARPPAARVLAHRSARTVLALPRDPQPSTATTARRHRPADPRHAAQPQRARCRATGSRSMRAHSASRTPSVGRVHDHPVDSHARRAYLLPRTPPAGCTPT